MGSWADEMEDMPVCKSQAFRSVKKLANLHFSSRYVTCYLSRHPQSRIRNEIGITCMLTTADSRTGYGGGQRTTYNSSTGAYGGSGGQFNITTRHSLNLCH